jgi:hypothetical protein
MKRILIAFVLAFLSGCATIPHYRVNPAFKGYFGEPKTIAIMPPDVKIHRLTAGGVSELMDGWSQQAESAILKAIKNEMRLLSSTELTLIDDSSLQENSRDFLKEQQGLFNAVAFSIISHTYIPESTFRHKLKNFDYTLGSEISGISEIVECDAILFSSGCNYIWTAGRTSLQFFALLVGAATGVTIIIPAGPEWIMLSLVDAKSGDVIWFDYIAMPGDLRKDIVASRSIAKLFYGFFAGLR